MKGIFATLLLLVSFTFYGQQKERIGFLNLVGNHIQVPRGCEAQSEYEIQACDGTSIKWDYYSEDMLSDVFDATISAFAKSNTAKSAVVFTSFGSELKGYKFKLGDTFQYFLQGKIGDQSLMMNLGTPVDINSSDHLGGLLAQLFEKVG